MNEAPLLVLAGMRSLGDSPEAYNWAHDLVVHTVVADLRATLVTGGTSGPEVWAAALALRLGLRVVCYLTDGRRTDSHRPDAAARWAPATVKTSTYSRDEALARDLGGLARSGRRVVVVGLLDATENPARSGTVHRLRLLEESGLAVRKFTWGQAPATTQEAAPVAAE